jgi:virginiamycin A acetyltransferase
MISLPPKMNRPNQQDRTAPNGSAMRANARTALVWLLIIVAAPLWLLAKFEARFSGSDEFFATCSQWLSLMPGKLGIFLRRAFYRCTLDEFSTDCAIGFGTTLAHRQVRIGRGVYIGVRCSLGCVAIEDHVTIGSNVDILSGRRQHGIDDLDVPIQEQPGHYSQVRIGRNSWIGNSAVVMANVGENCVIGAGSVVVGPIPAQSVAVGNPCRVTKQRGTQDAGRTTQEVGAR